MHPQTSASKKLPATTLLALAAGLLALSACDPTVPIWPVEPDRCDVGETVLCAPDISIKPKPGAVTK